MLSRERNLDNLRVLATFMVVVLHVSALFVASNIEIPNIYFTISNFFDSISRISVPIFVMLSGTFILDNPKNRNYRVFYQKTLKNIIIPMLTWSLIYFLYSLALEIPRVIILGKEIEIMRHVVLWIEGKPFYHLWYLYMIVGLYFISPALIRLKEDIGEENTFKLGGILTFIGFISSFTSDLFWPILFIEYIGYFVLGYSIRKYYFLNPKKPFKYILGSIISGLLVFVSTEALVRMGWGKDKLYFYNNLSPFVIAGTIFLFIVFVNIRNTKLDLNILAKHTFNIYLIHAGLLDIIRRVIYEFTDWNPNPIWFIPVLAIIVFGLSYVGSLMVYWFLDLKFSRRIKNKIEEIIMYTLVKTRISRF